MRRPLRPVAHRAFARRQRSNGVVQLAARPRARAGLPPPHRGHRPRTVHHGVGGASWRTCAGWVSTGTRASRWAARWGRTGSRSASTSTARIPRRSLGRDTPTAASARSRSWRPSARRNWQRGSPLDTPAPVGPRRARERERRQAAGEPAVVRLRVPAEPGRRVRGSGARPVTFHTDQIGDPVLVRSDGVPAYNYAVVDRRPPDGHHARDPRRGPHLEHATAGAGVPGLRLDAARVRASLAGPGTRSRAAVETPRRHVGRGVPCQGLSARGAGELPGAHRMVAADRSTRRS